MAAVATEWKSLEAGFLGDRAVILRHSRCYEPSWASLRAHHCVARSLCNAEAAPPRLERLDVLTQSPQQRTPFSLCSSGSGEVSGVIARSGYVCRASLANPSSDRVTIHSRERSSCGDVGFIGPTLVRGSPNFSMSTNKTTSETL